MPPDLALWSTLISSNYPCLDHIFMVPKMFEPLKFYCNYEFWSRRISRIEKCTKYFRYKEVILKRISYVCSQVNQAILSYLLACHISKYQILQFPRNFSAIIVEEKMLICPVTAVKYIHHAFSWWKQYYQQRKSWRENIFLVFLEELQTVKPQTVDIQEVIRQATIYLFPSRGEHHAGQDTVDTHINTATEPHKTQHGSTDSTKIAPDPTALERSEEKWIIDPPARGWR